MIKHRHLKLQVSLVQREKKQNSFYFIPNVFFFSLFISIVGPRPLTLLKAPTRSMLKLEFEKKVSVQPYSQEFSRTFSMLLNTTENRNNSSTTFSVQHHARPVEQHAWSMEHVWDLFGSHLPVYVCDGVTLSEGNLLFPMERTNTQCTPLPTMLCTHHCTGILCLLRRIREEGKEDRTMHRNEFTPEAYSLWGFTQHFKTIPQMLMGVCGGTSLSKLSKILTTLNSVR